MAMIKKRITLILVALLAGAATLMAQNISVTGKVTDEQGQPVIAAGVKDMTNQKNGTVSDIEGNYIITVSPNAILEFSFLGYKTQLVHVDGKKVLDVKLEPDNTVLESAVAIGYGTSLKGDLTGSVAVVEMEGIQETPVASVAQALQGRIAGADIISGSGDLGENTSIQIRGARSISAGNQPLIVVDGVADAVSSLDDINPSDIVSISVLKDVSSTAIYGSRGANGVILVTTDVKKDKGAKVSVLVKSVNGVSQIAGKLDLMDATEYATWYNMVSKSYHPSAANSPQSSYPYPDPSVMGKGTDWIDVLSQTGIYSSHYAQIYGKTANTNILASGGYRYIRGVVVGQSERKTYAKTSINSKVGRYTTLGLRLSLAYTDLDRTNAKISGTDTQAAIFLTPVLDKTSTWNRYAFEDDMGVVFNNPYIAAQNVTNRVDIWNLTATPWVKFKLSRNLTLESNFSFMKDNNLAYVYSPSTMPVAAARHQGGTATRNTWEQQKFLSETTLNFKRNYRGGHSLEALAGFTASRMVRDWTSYTGTGFINDKAMYYNMLGVYNTANYNENSYNTVKETLSALGRINYNYKRRYYFTFTARADGASNFSEKHKWGFFPAAAFRWSIMNEPWMSKSYWLNDLSLRISAGRSGNDAISSYLSYATVDNMRGTWLFNGKFLLSTIPGHLANSNLTWETTDALNIGLNYSGWRSRVNVEMDAYYSVTRDLLLSVKNSQVTGYDTYFNNMGSTRNMGVEFTLNTKNIKSRNFKWDTSFTISHNDQVVLDSGAGDEVVPTFSNPRNSTQYLYGYKTGYPVNALWGYQSAGVWHNQEEVERNKYTHTYVSTIQEGSNGSNVGRSRYIDVNGDGLLDQKDVVYFGNSDPVVYGGFQNDFTFFGKLNLNIFWAYSLGGKIYNLSELWLGSSTSSYNKYRYVLDAWDEVRNPNSDIAKPGWDDTLGTDRQIHDASYLRLKTVTVSYDVPLKKKKLVKKMNVGVSAENLWLISSYNGFDPDVSTSSTVRRLDNGSYPRSRTVTFNIQLNF